MLGWVELVWVRLGVGLGLLTLGWVKLKFKNVKVFMS